MSTTESRSVEVIIKGTQASSTLKEMSAAASVLRSQLSKLPADSKAFSDKASELKNVNTRLQAINADIKNVKSSWAETAKGFVAGTLITKGIGAITSAFADAKQVHKEYEASLKNLQAITGASNKDLEFYGAQARQMGGAVKGGATAVVEAFKLIGSAKPELLANKEALAGLTESAILLSQASGLELPEAATRLTDAMNQFGAPASQAVKYVDALAAGAKFGAAEIPDVTDALLKFGVTAKGSNINIQQSVGLVELLGEKGIKGAEAGTALRNVFSKLSASAILPKEAVGQLQRAGVNIKMLSDKTIPLQDRLKELSKIQGNAAAITQVFGLENKNAADVIISSLPRLAELTDQVSQTGAAHEQAATNIDTFEQAELEAKNAYNDLLLEITEGDFGAILKKFVEVGTQALKSLKFALHDIGLIFKNGFSGASFEKAAEGMDMLTDKYIEQNKKLTAEQRRANAEEMFANGQRIFQKAQANKDLTQEERKYQYTLAQIAFDTSKKILAIDKKEAEDLTAQGEKQQEQLTKGERKLNDKLLEERKKFLEELSKLEEEYHLKGLSDEDKRLFQAQKRRDEGLKKAGADKDTQLRVEAIFQKELNEIFGTLKMQQVKTNDDGNKQISESNINQVETNATIAKADFEDRLNMAAEYYQKQEALTNAFISRADKLMDMQKQKNIDRRDAELKKNEDALNREDAKDKELLKAKLISEDEYNKRHDALVKQKDARDLAAKKKAAEQNKKIAVAQAVIHGISSVMKTLAEYSYPANIILAALDAALVGIEIANIKKAPAYAKGGFNTQSDNPSGFVNQATLFTKSASGQPFIAGEAGAEWIAPNWMLNNPATANIIEHLESIRQSKTFAAGGSTSSQTTSNSSAGASIPQMSVALFNEMRTLLQHLVNNGVQATLGFDNYTRSLEKIENAQSAARIG
jgi:TP901 family phage tail tape measure protein